MKGDLKISISGIEAAVEHGFSVDFRHRDPRPAGRVGGTDNMTIERLPFPDLLPERLDHVINTFDRQVEVLGTKASAVLAIMAVTIVLGLTV